MIAARMLPPRLSRGCPDLDTPWLHAATNHSDSANEWPRNSIKLFTALFFDGNVETGAKIADGWQPSHFAADGQCEWVAATGSSLAQP